MNRACALALVALAACTPDPEPPAPNATPKPRSAITVFVTGDVGGEPFAVRGAGGLAGQVAAARTLSATGGVVLDAGDRFFRAYRVPAQRRAEAERTARVLARALARTQASAMAVGERDLALGLGPLRALAALGKVELVSANLHFAGTATAAFRRFALVPRGDQTLGVVAVSPRFSADDPQREAYVWSGLEASPPVPALAAAAVAARAAGATQVVGLLHLPKDEAIAAFTAVEALDAVVIAHDRGPDARGRVGDRPWAVARDRNRSRVLMRVGGEGRAQAEVVASDRGSDDAPTRLEVETLRHPLPEVPRTYVGTKRCAGECHAPALKHWRRTPHAKAMRPLIAERQERNLDCLPCHTTGLLRPGGARDVQTAVTKFRNVSCEACHGPQPAHIADPEGAGAGKVARRVCAECHRLQAYQKRFEIEPRWRAVLGRGHGASAL